MGPYLYRAFFFTGSAPEMLVSVSREVELSNKIWWIYWPAEEIIGAEPARKNHPVFQGPYSLFSAAF